LRKRQLLALTFAILAVLARLPFLLTHKIAFDSDEAVEGLMARHLLHGEFPAFLWGQAFKGVPEVYAAAGAFALFGSSVTVLKSVTLVFFALFVGLNFMLLDALYRRWIAAGASALLILSPPALVFWSLDASAEYVLIMLLGTLLLWLARQWQRNPLPPRLFAIGCVVGAGLWVQQVFVIYLVPTTVLIALEHEIWGRIRSWKLSPAVAVVAAIAVVYASLAVVAFLGGGFSAGLLSVRAPQKMLRIAAAIGALAMALHVLQHVAGDRIAGFIRSAWPFAAGFVTGYAPVLLYSLLVEPAHSPARNATLKQLVDASPDILGNVIPIVAGFKIATTERLPIPPAAALPALGALSFYIWVNRRNLHTSLADSFFPAFVLFVPLLFVVSGAYLDTQSYRYLIPIYAGLCVACAAGSRAIGKAFARRGAFSVWISTAVLLLILSIGTWQQVLWFQRLDPDTASAAKLDCLRDARVRGGYADYWTSYKLTFLSNEEIIVAPRNGADRYKPYSEFVKMLSRTERVEDVDEFCK